ncbi:MAG: P1 family peptidase [Pseudomonadota bacterium]
MSEAGAPGARNLLTDVPGLLVGQAEDERLGTGVTCVTGPDGLVAGVDLRGGAPGARELALLDPAATVPSVDALVLTGGSAFGLEAASGVMAALAEGGRGFPVSGVTVPIVPAAVIFDLPTLAGGVPAEGEMARLGRAALAAAGETFALGSHGAGRGAREARWKGGLGSASARLSCGGMIGALVVVNAAGSTTYPGSRHFLAWPWEEGAEFGGLGPPETPPRRWQQSDGKPMPLGTSASEGGRTATTIGVIATDIALDKAGAQRLAVAAQAGLARAIAPAHTHRDGDLVFGVSTGRRSPADRVELEHYAATAMARAIARGVHAVTPRHGDRAPSWAADR